MGIGATLYNVVLRRTSTFTIVVVASAFVFERGFDLAADKIFDTINKGKLWKHIKDKYEQ
ncbi:cytochrome b-c1 complex subunit 9 [Cataglyphis hispanica]|uniref:cytochrome b-c1 complex subunit 9 n=1 Tax=Cataglyphis hispanica TaxID=1086592 RepID=UPI002180372A|nr:cytochrome b-c1 complex subunit 9 [Cataglyphis hispanica]